MRTVKCKNCGAAYEDNLARCPYCGTMNKKGAYADFRKKISSMIDSILGLKDDVHRSVSRIILSSLIRSLIIIAVIVALGFVASRFANVNYYSDKEYDQEAYEEIVWLDEHIDLLNEAYEKGDYKTVRDLYYQNTKAVSKWTGYPSFCLREEYEKIQGAKTLNQYQLQRILYFVYFPEYLAGRNGMNFVDRDEYEEMRSAIISRAAEKGFTEEKLSEIFKKHADSYGYISVGDIAGYIKEELPW